MHCVYQDKDLAVFFKPSMVPTAPLKSQSLEGTLLGFAIESFPQIQNVIGFNPWEFGLLHRLDTPTSGLVSVALNQESFDCYYKMQKDNKITKTYLATVCEGSTKAKNTYLPSPIKTLSINETVIIKSGFRAFGPKGAQVRPTLDGKMYYTKITRLSESQVKCEITNGFRHQIRSHLAWIGLPIVSDTTYNEESSQNQMSLCCVELNFDNNLCIKL